jgi:hypothetical protein
MSRVFAHLDEALERVLRLREQLLADVYAPERAARLALVFESEARAWSQLFELTSLRPVWRAALAAEALARQNAQIWRQRAASVVTGEGVFALPTQPSAGDRFAAMALVPVRYAEEG